jgi:hypothetical protein
MATQSFLVRPETGTLFMSELRMPRAMNKEFTFTISSSIFDENYNPSENTRITTNFANLARGENHRQENLRNTLAMIDNRFNTLAHWDNPKSDRYSVELEIISVEMNIDDQADTFPAIEILKTNIIDNKTHERFEGIVAIISRLMYAIMISAYCCWIIISSRRNLASLRTLAICTAISSSISSTLLNTSKALVKHRSSA